MIVAAIVVKTSWYDTWCAQTTHKEGLSSPVEHGSNPDPYLNEVEAELSMFLQMWAMGW